MGRLALGGVVVVIVAEGLVLAAGWRTCVGVAGGLAAAFVLTVLWLWIDNDEDENPEDAGADAAEALDRWHARTEVMISWSDGTCGDWDRHLRPLIAREFEMSTGHKLTKDPAALDASGRMLFGAELWRWVDPAVVSGPDRDLPGPGRDSLAEILRRLETV